MAHSELPVQLLLALGQGDSQGVLRPDHLLHHLRQPLVQRRLLQAEQPASVSQITGVAEECPHPCLPGDGDGVYVGSVCLSHLGGQGF